MPIYHFNVRDSVTVMDPAGVELPNFPAARLEAIRRAGEMLVSDPIAAALGDDWQIEVTDSAGMILFSLTLLVHEAPAMLRTHVKR